jgi:hypothetical protein
MGLIAYIDESVSEGARISSYHCDFSAIFPPVMGGGLFQAGSTIGNGMIEFQDCEFMNRHRVSCGVLYASETVQIDPETQEVLPFEFMAFPVLPPHVAPEGGYIHSTNVAGNMEAPGFFLTAIYPDEEIVDQGEGRGAELEKGIGSAPFSLDRYGTDRVNPSTSAFVPFTHLIRSIVGISVPITSDAVKEQPHYTPQEEDEESDEDAESIETICARQEGPVLHLQLPCRPKPGASALPQSIQHVYVKLTEARVKGKKYHSTRPESNQAEPAYPSVTITHKRRMSIEKEEESQE